MAIIIETFSIFTPTGDIFEVINDPELKKANALKPPTEITKKRKMLWRLILIKASDLRKIIKLIQP